MLNAPIRLSCWNVQGLQNTMYDDYFRNYIYNNDIIFLTETWLSDNIDVYSEDFYNYHNLRPMHARARRPSGGISILIRHKFRGCNDTKSVQIVQEHNCFIWLKLDKEKLNLSRNIYICAVYIPPAESTFLNHQDFNPFQLLEQDIMKFERDGEVLLLGDFNARTSDRCDYSPDFIGGESVENIARNCDSVILDKLCRKKSN
jgi:exonuclease III